MRFTHYGLQYAVGTGDIVNPASCTFCLGLGYRILSVQRESQYQIGSRLLLKLQRTREKHTSFVQNIFPLDAQVLSSLSWIPESRWHYYTDTL